MKPFLTTSCMLASLALTACAMAQSTEQLAGGTVVKSGTLRSEGHEVAGTVSIVEYRGNTYAVLSDDFSFDGAPDPYVGFGNDDKYASDSTVAPLNTFEGGHYYRLPAKIDASAYDDFFIWCQMFSVPLAHADL